MIALDSHSVKILNNVGRKNNSHQINQQFRTVTRLEELAEIGLLE
jgi:hypothetical protein